MNQSLFVQFLSYFTSIAKSYEEKINGKKTALTYLYKDALTEELSVDLRWNTLSVNSNIVAADVVALDSSLPLKKRDAFATASGEIPKIGTKRFLSEKQMTDIDVLKARNVETKVIVEKVFADEKACIGGIHEKLEMMFLMGLSTGVALMEDENNVGTGIRVDYGYSDENKYGVEFDWSLSSAKPIDDIKRVLKAARAKGDVLKYIWMSDATFDLFAQNQQTRENYAFTQNFVGTAIPTPDQEQVNALMQRKFGLTIIVVDRTVTTERDGVRTIHTPWETNNVVLTTTMKVGKLQYGILAEETRKSPKVMYTKSGSFILVKKWSTEEPFSEFTSSQCLAVPVINNVSSIYLIDVTDAEAGAQTEGNTTINIFEDTGVLRSNLLAALSSIGVNNASDSNTDAELIAIVNKLSKKKENDLRDALELPTVDAGTNTTANSSSKALTGTATAFGDKSIETVAWSQVSGPNTASFSAANALSTNATGLVTGTYVFKLTVTDSAGVVASDTITITATVS